jgi:hypothetical protein
VIVWEAVFEFLGGHAGKVSESRRPNKPMVPTAPATTEEPSTQLVQQHIGRPLGREQRATSDGVVGVGNVANGLRVTSDASGHRTAGKHQHE